MQLGRLCGAHLCVELTCVWRSPVLGFQVKRQQDLQKRALALKREAELQRAAVRQLRAQLQQQQQLLTTREQEHR